MPKNDHMLVKATIDHDTIRRWAAERGGVPARARILAASGGADRTSGMLRIDFWGDHKALEPLTWESFFAVFDLNRFAFLYQEMTADGISRFYSVIPRIPDREHSHPVREALTEANRSFRADKEWIDGIAHELEEDIPS